jgi:hypothetical protein
VFWNFNLCHYHSSLTLFDIFKMRVIFKSVWVRKLIGKLGVPYNRRLGVRGSSHPLDYDADLSFSAVDSNAFRAHSDWVCLAWRIAPLIVLCSSGDTRVTMKTSRFLAFGTAGLPIFDFIKTLCITKIIVDKRYNRLYI